ncbi:MAG: thioredoxin family protein [Proteobacteria bacterium]|nr:thioredoxin family protein [Pseudomonadota bacterium]
MLRRLFTLLVLYACAGTAAAAGDIAVVYLGTNDCPYCQHWEARAKGELMAELRGSTVRYFEVKGETLRRPIVERHYPDELKWLARKLGPARGVPRFILLVDGEIAWSVFGTNDYERIFLPALRQAMARADGRARS